MKTANATSRKRLSLGTLLTMLTVLCIADPTTRRSTAQRGETNQAELVLRADQPQGKINRNIYGQFAEHLGRLIYGGLWVGEDSPIPNTRGIRNDVVAALKNLNVPDV